MDRERLSSNNNNEGSTVMNSTVLGTTKFMSPERLRAQKYSRSSDIWSLGCIFGELLSMQEGSVPNYQDRVPLFPGGSCYPLSGDQVSTDTKDLQDHLSVIFSVIGMPSGEDLLSVGKVRPHELLSRSLLCLFLDLAY